MDQKSIVLIARGIFATFNTFIDRKSCLLVENTIKVLINHEKYGKEFIQWLSKGIIELSKKNRPTIRATSTSNMNKLIRWACLLLSTSLSGLDSQTIDHLISEICLLFGVASSAPWHSIQTSITHFQNVLKKVYTLICFSSLTDFFFVLFQF